ncbi:MAG: hypothetical protein M3Z37_09410 [Candidatus Eremiobacteraeota bacterium]|nr:hypothetical protein [Candidatus Eremiobacteraeota bacterium]
MQRAPQKRQIIKTRPQRPYIIARILIALVLLAAAIAGIVAFAHAHAAHAGAIFFIPEVRAMAAL